jgi:alcohol dehydrogenase
MTTMQRWELSAFGRENLSLVSVPRPVPGADEVLVEVETVSLNFRDSLIMENRLGWRAPSGGPPDKLEFRRT